MAVKRIIIGAVAVLGISMGSVQPAMAATSATPQQCAQAKTAIANLRQLAASTSDPRLQRAYLDMAAANTRALTYYC